jgi:Outer membrane protein beta-barrel domain
MKRALLIALAALAMPVLAQAQVEVGVDAGLGIQKMSGATDKDISIDIPTSGLRVGFAGGESLIVETMLDFGWDKYGDQKTTFLTLVPGVNFMVTPQVYVRGEAGLNYFKYDSGTGSSSQTQYVFGGAVGTRKMLGEGALLRLEAGVDRGLEKKDSGVVTIPASWDFRLVAGISAVVGG